MIRRRAARVMSLYHPVPPPGHTDYLERVILRRDP